MTAKCYCQTLRRERTCVRGIICARCALLNERELGRRRRVSLVIVERKIRRRQMCASWKKRAHFDAWEKFFWFYIFFRYYYPLNLIARGIFLSWFDASNITIVECKPPNWFDNWQFRSGVGLESFAQLAERRRRSLRASCRSIAMLDLHIFFTLRLRVLGSKYIIRIETRIEDAEKRREARDSFWYVKFSSYVSRVARSFLLLNALPTRDCAVNEQTTF